MISYAQNGEDIVLRRAFPEPHVGFYVDIGAHHPVDLSVTKHFYDRGWSGVNIDASPKLLAAIAKARPRDINLCVGVSDHTGDLTFYEGDKRSGGLSTFQHDEVERHKLDGFQFRERVVRVRPLAEIVHQHIHRPVDFLSVDVEGHEREVLAGADFSSFRPRVVVIESTRPRMTEPTHQLWEDLLLRSDYRFALFDGLNRYYVRSEDEALVPLLSVPANILDGAIAYPAWRNQQRLARLMRNPIVRAISILQDALGYVVKR